MKLVSAFSLIIFILLTSCSRKETYGGRISIDPDTEAITPLNQEACYYLAFECLTKRKPKEARDYLIKLKTFPQPASKKLILEEGAKTLWALSYLEEKNYPEALKYMRLLKSVKALPEEPNRFNPESSYNQLRHVRSSSIQLRNSLPALEEYFAKLDKNALKPALYASLKKQWNVSLPFQLHNGMSKIRYNFPSLPQE